MAAETLAWTTDTSNEPKIQKHSKIFSVGFSVLAHVSVVVLIQFFHQSSPVVEPEAQTYVDLDYKQFDEVPQVVSNPVPVTHEPKEVQEKSEPDTVKPAEMQDSSSEVAGLQKEVTPPKVAPTNANTTSVPYYKVKPKYPHDALESNIEGFVMLKIDIQEDGSVENIKVTGGDNLGVFESAATRAVAKWKYKTFTDEAGKPVKKTDYLVRVDFKIKDEVQTN